MLLLLGHVQLKFLACTVPVEYQAYGRLEQAILRSLYCHCKLECLPQVWRDTRLCGQGHHIAARGDPNKVVGGTRRGFHHRDIRPGKKDPAEDGCCRREGQVYESPQFNTIF